MLYGQQHHMKFIPLGNVGGHWCWQSFISMMAAIFHWVCPPGRQGLLSINHIVFLSMKTWGQGPHGSVDFANSSQGCLCVQWLRSYLLTMKAKALRTSRCLDEYSIIGWIYQSSIRIPCPCSSHPHNSLKASPSLGISLSTWHYFQCLSSHHNRLLIL